MAKYATTLLSNLVSLIIQIVVVQHKFFLSRWDGKIYKRHVCNSNIL